MSHDPKGPSGRRHEDVLSEGGMKPIIRKCDDPSANFERIRNQKLWNERERKRAQQLEEKQRR